MEHPLVVGVDGSESSYLAVDWAVEEATRMGLSLRIVHASLWERYESELPSVSSKRPAEQVMAEHIAASAAERVQRLAPDLKIRAAVVPQDPVTALLHEEREAAALVVGSRGRGAISGLLLGSVSLKVASRAQCPVVVVRGSQESLRGEKHRVVLGLSGRDDIAAVRFALNEAEARGCPLHVLTAWRAPAVKEQAGATGVESSQLLAEEEASIAMDDALRKPMSEHSGVVVHRGVVEGSADKALLEASTTADLLVVGATRARGAPGLQLGSVSHPALHHSDCPVAVVPRHV